MYRNGAAVLTAEPLGLRRCDAQPRNTRNLELALASREPTPRREASSRLAAGCYPAPHRAISTAARDRRREGAGSWDISRLASWVICTGLSLFPCLAEEGDRLEVWTIVWAGYLGPEMRVGRSFANLPLTGREAFCYH